MKIWGELVDWLCEIDPASYLPFVVYERGVKVLYLLVTKAIYGMLEAGLLWYRKLKADLEEQGFVFNDYDPCVANRIVEDKQHTVRFHVDDVLSSHVDEKVNDRFAIWCQEKYGSLKEVEIRRGQIHQFLGMELDFSEDGVCKVKQFGHIEDMISMYADEIGEKIAQTPASNHLFERGEGRLLSDPERESFHSTVAKGLHVSTRSRPDIIPTISVLCGRVKEPNISDKDKLIRLLKYLNGTKKLHLTLRYDGLSLARWHIDSSFACHPDFRSQSGGVLMMHPGGGGIASGSTRQKLNTRSSTMAELVAVDDFLSKILWVRNFLSCQGIEVDSHLLQDNKSTILMCTKGREVLSKRTRAMNVRYFAVKDNIEKGYLRVMHVGTSEMLGDYFTKPLQGSKFFQFRDLILGKIGQRSSAQAVGTQ